MGRIPAIPRITAYVLGAAVTDIKHFLKIIPASTAVPVLRGFTSKVHRKHASSNTGVAGGPRSRLDSMTGCHRVHC